MVGSFADGIQALEIYWTCAGDLSIAARHNFDITSGRSYLIRLAAFVCCRGSAQMIFQEQHDAISPRALTSFMFSNLCPRCVPVHASTISSKLLELQPVHVSSISHSVACGPSKTPICSLTSLSLLSQPGYSHPQTSSGSQPHYSFHMS